MNAQPSVSVVTIAFNDREGLRTTMASVLAQTYPNIEYIVIDGGSTDGSVDLLREHAASLAYWVSEPDRGIYDAINKGARHTTGDWVIFMNAGDDFASPEVVRNVFARPTGPEIQFIYGDRIVKYDGYHVTAPAGPTQDLWKGSQFSHQAVFIRGDFQRAHSYNLANRISADFELFFSAYTAGLGFLRLNAPIARVSAGGLSDRARLENIAAFYRVARRLRPGLKTHAYYLLTLALQSVKLTAKRAVPAALIDRYRKRFRQLT